MLPENKKYNRLTKDDISNIIIHVFGNPMSGKTQFASTFPKPLIISTDGNFSHLETPAILIEPYYYEQVGSIKVKKTGYEKLVKLFEELVQNNHKPEYQYETIVLDVIEDFVDIIKVHILSQIGVEHEDDIDSKGWNKARFWSRLREFFKRFLRLIGSLNLNVVFISHAKDVVDNNGNSLNIFTPNLSTRYTNILQSGVSMVGYSYISNEKTHAIQIKSSRIPLTEKEVVIYNNYNELLKVIKKI